MKTSDLTVSAVYAYSKDTYDKGHAVLVLDTKNWSMGKEWSEGKKQYVIREAKPSERPNDGSFRNDYRHVGIPVLKIDQDLFHWDSSTNPEAKILDSHEDILTRATKLLGIEQASDAAGIREKSISVHVPVTMGNGKKSTVSVTLTTVRPQTITSAWGTHLENRRKAQVAQAAYQKANQAEATRRNQVNDQITTRMDALLGEAPRHWRGSGRQDCYREAQADFTISVATLMRLLELAEKGAQR